MNLRILNIAANEKDNKYTCELSVVNSIRNQKVVLTLEEEDLVAVLKKVKDFTDANPNIQEQAELIEGIPEYNFENNLKAAHDNLFVCEEVEVELENSPEASQSGENL